MLTDFTGLKVSRQHQALILTALAFAEMQKKDLSAKGLVAARAFAKGGYLELNLPTIHDGTFVFTSCSNVGKHVTEPPLPEESVMEEIRSCYLDWLNEQSLNSNHEQRSFGF